MKRSNLGVLIATLCVATAAMATTYVRVEKDGTKTYSDRPIPGGQPIEIQPAPSSSTPQASGAGSRPSREEEQADNFSYNSCTLTPANDSTFTNPEEVIISFASRPLLRPFDSVFLTVDGQAVEPPGASTFKLTPVFRGTHAVVATVRNRAGMLVCTATTSFHVMRPSINSPARR
ncbi:MAG: DUF4124 domain-containing protein [Pseudomonadota bacterium]